MNVVLHHRSRELYTAKGERAWKKILRKILKFSARFDFEAAPVLQRKYLMQEHLCCFFWNIRCNFNSINLDFSINLVIDLVDLSVESKDALTGIITFIYQQCIFMDVLQVALFKLYKWFVVKGFKSH